MRKKLKITISIFFGTATILVVYIGLGLWAMAIEDRYGDLQEIYYKSKDGDLIVLKKPDNGSKKYGLIDKTWDRIFVSSSTGTVKQDLNQWVHADPEHIRLWVYRGDNKSIAHVLLEKPQEMNQLIFPHKLKLILHIN